MKSNNLFFGIPVLDVSLDTASQCGHQSLVLDLLKWGVLSYDILLPIPHDHCDTISRNKVWLIRSDDGDYMP